ncbi:unnamed protein product [Prorocentrum cordatum]|uniref:Uncharacterized protein n=1 Tax=Prorocentrum cordatum TaxID=2364126 RepID=A0ABN9QQ07_9DINO|nr:unnamed protein product [Polarella glacialis]
MSARGSTSSRRQGRGEMGGTDERGARAICRAGGAPPGAGGARARGTADFLRPGRAGRKGSVYCWAGKGVRGAPRGTASGLAKGIPPLGVANAAVLLPLQTSGSPRNSSRKPPAKSARTLPSTYQKVSPHQL